MLNKAIFTERKATLDSVKYVLVNILVFCTCVKE